MKTYCPKDPFFNEVASGAWLICLADPSDRRGTGGKMSLSRGAV